MHAIGITESKKMSYNLEWLIGEFEKGKRYDFLFFWGHQKSKSGELSPSCFSQWWSSPFIVENVKYDTAEHWMMAQKALLFNDKEIFEKIIVAKSPAEAKALGRQVRNFDEATWISNRFDIVFQGCIAKFTQHKDLKEFLLSTQKRILVEASPNDRIWGIGLAANDEKSKDPRTWNGLNLLGFALMEARDFIRKDAK